MSFSKSVVIVAIGLVAFLLGLAVGHIAPGIGRGGYEIVAFVPRAATGVGRFFQALAKDYGA